MPENDLTKICQAIPCSGDSVSTQAQAILRSITGEDTEFQIGSGPTQIFVAGCPACQLTSSSFTPTHVITWGSGLTMTMKFTKLKSGASGYAVRMPWAHLEWSIGKFNLLPGVPNSFETKVYQNGFNNNSNTVFDLTWDGVDTLVWSSRGAFSIVVGATTSNSNGFGNFTYRDNPFFIASAWASLTLVSYTSPTSVESYSGTASMLCGYERGVLVGKTDIDFNSSDFRSAFIAINVLQDGSITAELVIPSNHDYDAVSMMV